MINEPLKELPQPKYQIGETVYFASFTTTTETPPCPECLGTSKWKIVTPSGAEFSTSCQRCDGRSTYDLPSLRYQRYAPTATMLTVGSIRIDTAHHSGRNVEYMCRETGVGSGSIYSEDALYPSRDQALAASQAMADERNAKLEAAPERIQQRHLGSLRITDAFVEQARQAIWNSWYSHNNFRAEVERIIAESDLQDIRDELEHELSFDKKYRDRHPFDKLLDAARKGDAAEIAKALEAFPSVEPEKVEDEL